MARKRETTEKHWSNVCRVRATMSRLRYQVDEFRRLRFGKDSAGAAELVAISDILNGQLCHLSDESPRVDVEQAERELRDLFARFQKFQVIEFEDHLKR